MIFRYTKRDWKDLQTAERYRFIQENVREKTRRYGRLNWDNENK